MLALSVKLWNKPLELGRIYKLTIQISMHTRKIALFLLGWILERTGINSFVFQRLIKKISGEHLQKSAKTIKKNKSVSKTY